MPVDPDTVTAVSNTVRRKLVELRARTTPEGTRGASTPSAATPRVVKSPDTAMPATVPSPKALPTHLVMVGPSIPRPKVTCTITTAARV